MSIVKNTIGRGAALMDELEHECRIEKNFDENSYPETVAAIKEGVETAQREALKEFIVEAIADDLRHRRGPIADALCNMISFALYSRK